MNRISILFLGLICICSTVFGQKADQIQRGQHGYSPSIEYASGAFIELKDPYEEAMLIVPKCAEAFALDAFQKEILKSMIIRKVEDDNAILNDEANTRDSRKSKLQQREKSFLVELNSILNTEQIEAFRDMDFTETKEERREKKRKKKGKKNKSN